MTQEPRFIALEGLDGTGKSTLARALAERLSAELLATPDEVVKRFRADADTAFPRESVSSTLFYAACVARVSDRVRALLARGRTVVVDRYWLSTRAYASVLGVDLALNEVSARLVAPTHTLYVRTEHAVRVARLAERGVLEHDRPTFDLAIAGRLEAAYLGLRDDRLAARWWTVDSTHKSAEALAMTLASRLSRSSARAVRVA